MKPTHTTKASVIEGAASDIEGFLFKGGHAGIKIKHDDLALIVSDRPATGAGVFTLNKFAAAPVIVSREHLVSSGGNIRAIVVNSGCANAATGEHGVLDARAMAQVTAGALGIDANQVLVSSTGVIGRFLPIDKITTGVHALAATLNEPDPGSVSRAIMTTDTVPKEILVEVAIGDKTIRVGGVAKGSGMIHPNMATMLAFLVTDAAVPAAAMQTALKASADDTFNMISVDGDTSTNDMVAIIANGASGVTCDPAADPVAFDAFKDALGLACRELAIKIARDGEGAGALVEVRVSGARTVADARLAARAVTSSNLVKTAIFGKDPNWGRIVAAVGYSGAHVDPNRVDLTIASAVARARLVKNGQGADTLDFDELRRILGANHVKIHVKLNIGDAEATAWGCDMSYDYVKINASYTT